jgi:hypothetical protein
MGMISTGVLLEVFASAKGESWTAVVTTPRGMSCLLASGENWTGIEWKSLAPST